MFLLLSALQRLMPRVNDDGGEREETDSASVASSVSRSRKQTDIETMSRDGTASQRSLQSVEIASVGYNSDQEDDDYVHIYNSEYSFGDESCAASDRASSRGLHWSSSKQSLTSLLETLREDGMEVSKDGCQKQEPFAADGLFTTCNDEWDDYEVIDVHHKSDEDRAHTFLEDHWTAGKNLTASIDVDGAMSMLQGAFENVASTEVNQDEGNLVCKNRIISNQESESHSESSSNLSTTQIGNRNSELETFPLEEMNIAFNNPQLGQLRKTADAPQYFEKSAKPRRSHELCSNSDENVTSQKILEKRLEVKKKSVSSNLEKKLPDFDPTKSNDEKNAEIDGIQCARDGKICMEVAVEEDPKCNIKETNLCSVENDIAEANRNTKKNSEREEVIERDATLKESFILNSDKQDTMTDKFIAESYSCHDENEVQAIALKDVILESVLEMEEILYDKERRKAGNDNSDQKAEHEEESVSKKVVTNIHKGSKLGIDEPKDTISLEKPVDKEEADEYSTDIRNLDNSCFEEATCLLEETQDNSNNNEEIKAFSKKREVQLSILQGNDAIQKHLQDEGSINTTPVCVSLDECMSLSSTCFGQEQVKAHDSSICFHEEEIYSAATNGTSLCNAIEYDASKSNRIPTDSPTFSCKAACLGNDEIKVSNSNNDLIIASLAANEIGPFAEIGSCESYITHSNNANKSENEDQCVSGKVNTEEVNISSKKFTKFDEALDSIAVLGECFMRQKVDESAKISEMFADCHGRCDNIEIKKIYLQDLVLDHVQESNESIYDECCLAIKNYQDELFEWEEEEIENTGITLDNQESSKIGVKEVANRIAASGEYSMQQRVEENAKADDMIADSLSCCDHSEMQQIELEDLVIDYVRENEESSSEQECCLAVNSCQDEMLESEEEQINVEIAVDPQERNKIEAEEVADGIAALKECTMQQILEQNAKGNEVIADSLRCCDQSEIQKIYLEDLVIDHVGENEESLSKKECYLAVNSCQDEMLEFEEESIKHVQITFDRQGGSELEVEEVVDRIAEFDECSMQQILEQNVNTDEMLADSLSCCDHSEMQTIHLEDLVINHTEENGKSIYDKGRCSAVNSHQDEKSEYEEEPIKNVEVVLDLQNWSTIRDDEFKNTFPPEKQLDNEEFCKTFTAVRTFDTECFKQQASFSKRTDDIIGNSQGFKAITEESNARPGTLQDNDTNQKIPQKKENSAGVPLCTDLDECISLSRICLEKEQTDTIETVKEAKRFQNSVNEGNLEELTSISGSIDHSTFSSKAEFFKCDKIKIPKSKSESCTTLLEMSERKGVIDKADSYESFNLKISQDTKKDEEEHSSDTASSQQGAYVKNFTTLEAQDDVKVTHQMNQSEDGRIAGMMGADSKVVVGGAADLNGSKAKHKMDKEADEESHAMETDCEDQKGIAEEDGLFEDRGVKHQEDVVASSALGEEKVNFGTPRATDTKQEEDEFTGRVKCKGEDMDLSSTFGNYDYLSSNLTVAKHLPNNSSAEHLVQRPDQFYLIDAFSNQGQDKKIEQVEKDVPLADLLVSSQREIECITDFSWNSKADPDAKNITAEDFTTEWTGEDSPEEHYIDPIEDNKDILAATSMVELIADVAQDVAMTTQEANEAQNKHGKYNGVSVEEYLEIDSQAVSHDTALGSSMELENQYSNDRNHDRQDPKLDFSPENFPETVIESERKYFYLGLHCMSSSNHTILSHEDEGKSDQFERELESYHEGYSNEDKKSSGVTSEEKLSREPEIEMTADNQIGNSKAAMYKDGKTNSEASDIEHTRNLSGNLEEQGGRRAADETDFDAMPHENAKEIDRCAASDNKGNRIEGIVRIEKTKEMTVEEYLKDFFEGRINDDIAVKQEFHASEHRIVEESQDDAKDLAARIHHKNDVAVEEYLMNYRKVFGDVCTNMESGPKKSFLLEDQESQIISDNPYQDLSQCTGIPVENHPKESKNMDAIFCVNKEGGEGEAGNFLSKTSKIESSVNKNVDEKNDIKFQGSQVQQAMTDNVSKSSANSTMSEPIHEDSAIDPWLNKKEVEEELLSKNLVRKLSLRVDKNTLSGTLVKGGINKLSKEGADMELNMEVDKISVDEEREPSLGKTGDEMEIDFKKKGKVIEQINNSESQAQNKCKFQQDRFVENEAGSHQQENYPKSEEMFPENQSCNFIETDLKNEAKPRELTNGESSANAKDAFSFTEKCCKGELTEKALCHFSYDKASETCDAEGIIKEGECLSTKPNELLQTLKTVDDQNIIHKDVEVQMESKVKSASYDDIAFNSNAMENIPQLVQLRRQFERPIDCIVSQDTSIESLKTDPRKAEEEQTDNRCEEAGSSVVAAQGSDESCEEKDKILFKRIMKDNEQTILPQRTRPMTFDETAAEAEKKSVNAFFGRQSQSIVNLNGSIGTGRAVEKCDIREQYCKNKTVLSEGKQLRMDWEGKDIKLGNEAERDVHNVEKLIKAIKWPTDETVLFDDTDSRNYKEEDSYSKHNRSFEKKPTFEALARDGKDCALSAEGSLALRDLNAYFSSQFEKELTLNVNEKDKTFSSDVNTSVTSDVNSEGNATTNESNDVLQNQLTILVTDGNKNRTKSSQLLIPRIRSNYYPVGTTSTKGVTCLRISVSRTRQVLTGLQTAEGSEKSREKNKTSSLVEEETRLSEIQQEDKVVLKRVACRVNVRASSKSATGLTDKEQPDPTLAVDEKEASMQTKDSTSSGDSDYRKEQVKPKRLYIRQKAFDKYSFQHSVEEHGAHDSDINHRFEMNRTDSEKLIEEGFHVPIHVPDTSGKVLTNAVSTDDPEVGTDITVIYNPRTEESCISIKQESGEHEFTDIDSYVVLHNEDIYANGERCENNINSKTDVDDGNKTSKKRGGSKNKSKVQKESQIKRKRSMKERRDRLQSDENDNDVFNDAITDLDMDAFDTGVDSAWNTDIDQDMLLNESFEQIIVDQKEKASKDFCDKRETPEGDDFDFEIVMKPAITDENEAESDFSIGISEDESVTVVMSFDKKLNLLRAIPPTLAPPKPTSGYSSEVEDDDETDDVTPRKKKTMHRYPEATANQHKDKQGKFPRWKISQKNSVERESMRNQMGSETATEKNADNSEVWKNSQILEYEVDWETPINEEASDKVVVDPETNIIGIGLRKGMIKGSRVWDKDSQAYKNQYGLANSTLKADSEKETNQGANVEEMPVVFMESDKKLEGNAPEKDVFRRDSERAGSSDEDTKLQDAEEGSNSKDSLERSREVVEDIKEKKVVEESSPGVFLRERRKREKRETPLQDTEEESILRKSLRERRQKAVEKETEQEGKDKGSLRESLRERRTREEKDAKQQDVKEESSSREGLRERKQKVVGNAAEEEEKNNDSLGESLREKRTQDGEVAQQQNVEEESNPRESLRERRQRAVKDEKRKEAKDEANFGKDLQERDEKERSIAKQQRTTEKSSMEMLQKRAEGKVQDNTKKEMKEKDSKKEATDAASFNVKEDRSPKENLREMIAKKEMNDSEQKIPASKGCLHEKLNGDGKHERKQRTQKEDISQQNSRTGNGRTGNNDTKEGPMAEGNSSIDLKERKTQTKCEEMERSTQMMNDGTDSGISKSSDRKIIEEVIEKVKDETSQYAVNEEPPSSFHDVREQKVEKNKGTTNLKAVKDGKEEATQITDGAINSATSAKNPELMAVVETMLKTNLPTEHKPEAAEWLEGVRLKEIGLIDIEVIGRSSIHEKITLENAFDEQLLADAEELQYWDRILEIKRMRRLSVRRKKELAANSAENVEADAHSIDNNRKYLDDNAIQSISNSSSGAEKDCRTDSSICNENLHATKELKETHLSKSLSKEQEKRVKESDLQQEIERLQARKVDSGIGKQDDRNEQITQKSDSIKAIAKDTLIEPKNGSMEDLLSKSNDNLSERSCEQPRKEETNSKSKTKKRGKSKAEKKGGRGDDNNEATKKVPLIKVTEPSTEVFFDSEELELDGDDEKFIEEVLKQLEERKRERRKQRELEELEELRMQSKMQKAIVDEDDINLEVQRAVSESNKCRESFEGRNQRSQYEDKELINDIEEQDLLEKDGKSKQTRIDDGVDSRERNLERIFNDDSDEAKLLKNEESSTGVVGKKELHSKGIHEDHDACNRRKERTSDEDHEDGLLVVEANGEHDAFLKGDNVSEAVKNQSADVAEDASRDRPRPRRRRKSVEGDEYHEAERNYDESPVSRARNRMKDNNGDDGVSRGMLNNEKIDNEAISQKTPSKGGKTEEAMPSPRRRRKKNDKDQDVQGNKDDQRREIRDKGEVSKEHEYTGRRSAGGRTTQRSNKESCPMGREAETTDVSKEQSNAHQKLIKGKPMSRRKNEEENTKRKSAEGRQGKVSDIDADQSDAGKEEPSSTIATRNKSFQRDTLRDSYENQPILDGSTGDHDDSSKDNKNPTARRERRSDEENSSDSKDGVKNENEFSDEKHRRRRDRGATDKETKRRPRKQKVDEADQENESNNSYSEGGTTRRRARSSSYEEDSDENPQSTDQNVEEESRGKERSPLRRNDKKDKDKVDYSIIGSSDVIEQPRERRRRKRIESDDEESSKTGLIENKKADQKFMEGDAPSSELKTRVKSATVRDKARHDGEKDEALLSDSRKMEEKADTPVQRKRRERKSKQRDQGTEDNDEKKDLKKDAFYKNETPVNGEGETEAVNEEQHTPRRRRRRNQRDEESEEDAKPRERGRRKRDDSEEESNSTSITRTNRVWKQVDGKDKDIQEKSEVDPSYEKEIERLQNSPPSRVHQSPEASKNDSVIRKEPRGEGERLYRHRKKNSAFADKEKPRTSQDYDEEMVGVLRSPSSRNEWKGAGSDRSEEESRSESGKGEAEDGSSTKELADTIVNEQKDDGTLIGSRRRSSCRNEWKTEGEFSRLEKEEKSSSQNDLPGEEGFQGNKSTSKDNTNTASESRQDQQLHATKKKLKHGSKESIEQMVGIIRSSSIRDEWKEIFKNQS